MFVARHRSSPPHPAARPLYKQLDERLLARPDFTIFAPAATWLQAGAYQVASAELNIRKNFRLRKP
jgi:hypothetical protein